MKGPFPNHRVASYLSPIIYCKISGFPLLGWDCLRDTKDQLKVDSEGTFQTTGPSPVFPGWRVSPKPQIPHQQHFWNHLANLFEIYKQSINIPKLWNRKSADLPDQQPSPIRASYSTRTLEDEAAFQRFFAAIITNPSTSLKVIEEPYPFTRAPDDEAAYHRFCANLKHTEVSNP